MKIKCEICGKNFISNRLSTHIKRTHKIDPEDYYVKYIGPRGKCLTCGKPTTFISMSSGYHRFCCNKCIGLNKDIQEHKKKTTKSHFGVEYPMQSNKVQAVKVQTLKHKYGCTNAFNIEKVQAKAQLNSHTIEANLKRGKSTSKTKKELFKDNKYKQSIIDKMISTNRSKYGVDWLSNDVTVRHKISESVKKSHVHNSYKYKYNNETFDSSYELAFYIYHIDNDISIIRKPCKYVYYINNKAHTYTPDFMVNDRIIEIKGKWFFKDNKLYNPYNGQLSKEKYQCMLDNNVEIIVDVQKYLNYCKNKFDDKYWYRAFRKTLE